MTEENPNSTTEIPLQRQSIDQLIFTYVGNNSAHRTFRLALANAKALAYVLAKGDSPKHGGLCLVIPAHFEWPAGAL